MPEQAKPSAPEHRQRQPGRGRQADTPGQIPSPGWKDVLWRTYTEITNDRVMLIAAGVTFYLLLALVPSLSALISIFGLFADPAAIREQAASLQGFIPGGGMEILNEQLERLASQESSTLGLTFVISLAIALWSANAGVKSLFEAMNVAYDETEKRGFVKLTLVSLSFTLGMMVVITLFIGVVILLPVVIGFLGLDQQMDWLIRIASFAGMLLLALTAVAALFRWGPSRDEAEWKWITPGAVVAVIVVAIVSVLFSWYVSNFGSYNETYGSLGAIIGFMTWIWISSTILIVGAELNAEMEHQTARDTTTAPKRPLGGRGATMADSVGPAVAGPEADDPEYSRSVQGAGGGGTRDDRTGRQRSGAHPAPQPISAGALALAVPVLLLMTWLQRRD